MNTMIDLNAGVFNLKYENGFLRYIKYGDTEIVRMIYFALRDSNWGTVPYVISDERIEAHEDSFSIYYICTHGYQNSPIVQWATTIEGERDGSITFCIQGNVLRDFEKNRAGFCVLHPLQDTRNQPCEVIHQDGWATVGRFPNNIEPHMPFQNISSFKWMVKDSWYTLSYEGDVFEMEDQRNWTDSSFKTYCTPLGLPFPVAIAKGERIVQRIVFKPEQRLTKRDSSNTAEIILSYGNECYIPAIGIAKSTEVVQLDIKATESIRFLKLNHYRVEIDLSSDGWKHQLINDWNESLSLQLALEVALHVPAEEESSVTLFTTFCNEERIQIKKLLLLTNGLHVTSEKHLSLVPVLKKALAGTLIGAGTNYNFTEINRNRFANPDIDFISYSLHPQEHAFDDLSLIENLEAQADTVQSCHGIYRETLSVHVSPVTLLRRFNPYATDPAARIRSNEARTDPRQVTPFNAVWTFGSILSLASAGCKAITYFQTVGKQGIIGINGNRYPVYNTLILLSEYQGKKVNVIDSTDPLKVQGMVVKEGDMKRLILANYTSTVQTCSFDKKTYELKPLQLNVIPI